MPNYTIVAAQGAYTQTGQTASLRATRKLVGGQGSYTLTGQTVAPYRAYRLVAHRGRFTYTGQTATLRKTYTLVATYGFYSTTGQATGPTHHYRLIATAGVYALSGQAALLLVGRKLIAAFGSYSLSGSAVGTLTRYTLTAAYGAYALTGQTASLRRSRRLRTDHGTYTDPDVTTPGEPGELLAPTSYHRLPVVAELDLFENGIPMTDSPSHIYTLGSLIRCTGVFTDPLNGDEPLDPTTVHFSYRSPDGVSTTLTYGTDSEVVRDSEGYYHCDLLLDQAKVWRYSFWSEGPTGIASDENSVQVEPRLST